MNALILNAELKTAAVQRIPIPAVSPTEILVRVRAVALNPVDALYTANPLGRTGRVVGSDFAGVVEKLGIEVPEASKLSKGTRVAGFLQGACSMNDRPGAFAEYIVIPWDLVWHVPDWVDAARAAGVPLCGLTAAQGLFYRLGLPSPFDWGGEASNDVSRQGVVNIFIYGASTSLGMYAAQLVRLSGASSGQKIRMIGAASPARHSMLRAAPYEYDDLVDYHAADWLQQIQNMCGKQGIDYAIDCISEGASVVRVNGTLGSQGKQAVFRSRAGGAWTSDGPLPVEPIYGAVWEGLGVAVEYQGFALPESPHARQFAVNFYRYLSQPTPNGMVTLEPNPVRMMPGGLEKIFEDGFVLLGPGSMEQRAHPRTEKWMAPVSAEKLVYVLL